MGRCRHCGLGAGLFRREHAACRSRRAREEELLASVRAAMPVEAIAGWLACGGDQVGLFRSLREGLARCSSRHHDQRTHLGTALVLAAERLAGPGGLPAHVSHRFLDLVDALECHPEDLRRNNLAGRIVLSAALARVRGGFLPPVSLRPEPPAIVLRPDEVAIASLSHVSLSRRAEVRAQILDVGRLTITTHQLYFEGAGRSFGLPLDVVASFEVEGAALHCGLEQHDSAAVSFMVGEELARLVQELCAALGGGPVLLELPRDGQRLFGREEDLDVGFCAACSYSIPARHMGRFFDLDDAPLCRPCAIGY